MIYYKTSGNEKKYFPEVINYPDGTLKIIAEELIDISSDDTIILTWQYENEVEMLILMYIANNLSERYANKRELYMPYLPNARMDRVHSSTEVFTLKYFCKQINSLFFSKITILDAHSSVGVALLDRAVNISPQEFIFKALDESKIDKDNDCIFFPDEGSFKRYLSLFSGYKNISFGIKKRNWSDGKIIGLDIAGASAEGRKVFIVDDICSYGGTVYHSSVKLKEIGCKDIFVFFSHCENSIVKGKLFESGLIEKIFTTDSICTLNENPKLKIYSCFE